jgi:uncharacterized protein
MRAIVAAAGRCAAQAVAPQQTSIRFKVGWPPPVVDYAPALALSARRTFNLQETGRTSMNTTQQTEALPEVSAELFMVPLQEDRFLVYAPLRRAAFVANAGMVNQIVRLRSGDRTAPGGPDPQLLELLRRLEIADAGAEPRPVTEFHGDPEPTSVSLFLTTTCNLRCTYCYASAGSTPARFMPIEVAQRGIDFVAGNAQRKGMPGFEVIFHGGGEPALNWRTLTGAMDHARQRATLLGLTVEGTTATNGVLNDSQVDWMLANLTGASVSFDGLPEVNDRHRITINGRGSSTQVMRTLRRFDSAEFAYGLRVTVTQDQIPRLPDSIEFLCRQFHPSRIQVEPAYALGRWADAPSAETAEFIEAYREAQGRAAALGREITYSAARIDTLTNHFCGITQDSFCLTPDGNVSACYEAFSEQSRWAKVFFYGKPGDETGAYCFDTGRLDHLRRQAVQHRPYCQGCFAKWHCAGDCHHKSLEVGGEGEFAGSDRCHITRELTKDQILARIAASGGLFWHGQGDATGHAQARGKELLR